MSSTAQREIRPRMLPVFGVLAIPPILFLFVTVGFAVFFGAQGADPQQIADLTQAAAPWILVSVQVSLLGLVLLLSRGRGGIGWNMPPRRRIGSEAAVGTVFGVALGLAYVFVLAPALAWVQAHFGDYVPPGSVLPTVGASLVPFFIADVALAPFVEESIYRGWVASRLLLRYGAWPAALIVCSAFGLLHWAGGVWYMLLVGFVAGGLFMSLRVLRKNLIAPFAAHLALNVVEYVSVVLSH